MASGTSHPRSPSRAGAGPPAQGRRCTSAVPVPGSCPLYIRTSPSLPLLPSRPRQGYSWSSPTRLGVPHLNGCNNSLEGGKGGRYLFPVFLSSMRVCACVRVYVCVVVAVGSALSALLVFTCPLFSALSSATAPRLAPHSYPTSCRVFRAVYSSICGVDADVVRLLILVLFRCSSLTIPATSVCDIRA